MPSLSEVLIVALALGGVVVYRQMKRSKFPSRLMEVETALRTQSDLALHCNKDPSAARELHELAEHLAFAQQLINAPSETVRRELGRVEGPLAHLASEQALTRLDLFYSDRRDDIKAAIYDLRSRLQKKAALAKSG